MSDDLFEETTRPTRRSRGRLGLVAVAVITVILWQFSFGRWMLWPFTLLATWYHEMGHGLTAKLLGGDFHRLEIHGNGSGVAVHSGNYGRISRALIAAGGPIAPSIAGGLMLVASRGAGATRFCLGALGAALLGSALLWVRTPVGIAAVVAFGIVILAITVTGSPGARRLTLQVLAVQACIALYQDLGYFFTSEVSVAGEVRHSDTGQIAQNLFLPHWFWASLITLFSLAVLLVAISYAVSDE